MTGAAADRASGPPPVVALVCSAGGLRPLEAILAALPATFPAAVIALQHQAPANTGVLAHILGRHCALPVTEAADGDVLVGGRVLVVPPGHHAVVTSDGRVLLTPTDGSMRYRPSADLLLTSLALTAGTKAVAVILSGAGSDGALGALLLHRCGGTVLASDVASSAYFAMPSAAIREADVVDRVVPVAEMASLLSSVVAMGAPASATVEELGHLLG